MFYALNWHTDLIGQIVTIAVFTISVGIALASTLYISYKHIANFSRTGEVYSPLITSRKKHVIFAFHLRLTVLFILLAIVAANMVVMVDIAMHMDDYNKVLDKALVMACSLTGFVAAILLVSTPELIRFYKQRKKEDSTHILNSNE